MGRFEDSHPLSGLVPSRRALAILNSNKGRHASRFIYSKKKGFIWYKIDDEIGDVKDFISLIQYKNAKK